MMANEGFSLAFQRAVSFSFEEVVFLSCGLEPLGCTTQTIEKQTRWITQTIRELASRTIGGGDFMNRVRWLSEYEYRTIDDAHDRLNSGLLFWKAPSYFNSDDSLAEVMAKEPESAKQILKIQVEGMRMGCDYMAILEGLVSEFLIPQCIANDVERLQRIRDAYGRNLAGNEVEAIRRDNPHVVNGEPFYVPVHNETLHKENIAQYFAASEIESVFDFGQKSLIQARSKDEQKIIGAVHQSENLQKVIQASVRFWKDAVPSDKSTHPTNSTVEHYLINNGLTERMAKSAAALIRPSWAASGRRPED